MKLSKAFLPTLREAPSDAVIASHLLMLRAAMIRRLSNGLYAYLPLGLRSFRKVERIVREEMDKAGALEIKPTVVVPAELWKESGRWAAMGQEMLRVKNRLGLDFVVSPTAEEAFAALVRDELSSYRQVPMTLYQINTKYRDEVRPRYGVMRGREFTMMDAYSFDADQADLDASYAAMARAYRRIFARLGLSVIPVSADTGAMGGTGSEEFMVESEVGDDTLVLCSCGYAANVEKAACRPEAEQGRATGERPSKIPTPGAKSIEELVAFLKTTADRFIKTLVYRARGSVALQGAALQGADKADAEKHSFVAVCIRGDLDVNEAKLAATLAASEVELASAEDVARLTGAPVGFAGPVGLPKELPVLADLSVTLLHDAYTGGLEADVHYAHVEPGRDFSPWKTADVRVAKAGDICSECGKALYEKKGNELGHIFKLGDKYTKSMNLSFLDKEGKARVPIMGCYGIGVDRSLASIIEEYHDDDGILWPMSVAPYQAIVVPMKGTGPVAEAADKLAAEMEALGLEVLVDDRDERPGVKFKDADLIGIPIRVVVGERNLPANVELKLRGEKEPRLVPLPDCAAIAAGIVQERLAALDAQADAAAKV